MVNEKNINLVENLIKEFKTYNDLDGIDNLKPYIEAIENMLNRNKELEEENKRLKPKIDVCNWQEKSCREIIDEKYIPVSLVKEKIEELKEEIEQLRIERNVTYDSGIYRKQIKIDILKELLDGE